MTSFCHVTKDYLTPAEAYNLPSFESSINLIQMQEQKIALAKSMTSLISSKAFISISFIVIMTSALFQILISTEDQLSVFIAVIPASTVIIMAWFTVVRRLFNKSENVWFQQQFVQNIQRFGIFIFHVRCIFSLRRLSWSWADSWMGNRHGIYGYNRFNNLFLGKIFNPQ